MAATNALRPPLLSPLERSYTADGEDVTDGDDVVDENIARFAGFRGDATVRSNLATAAATLLSEEDLDASLLLLRMLMRGSPERFSPNDVNRLARTLVCFCGLPPIARSAKRRLTRRCAGEGYNGIASVS